MNSLLALWEEHYPPTITPETPTSCDTCMSFIDHTCTDPQSLFCNERRHPQSSCPCWAKKAQ